MADKTNELATAGAQGQTQLHTKAAEIARALFVSTTYETSPSRSDTQYVTDLYYAYLHRAPDDPGLGFWSGQAAGSVQNRINVLNGFEASGEFQTLVSTLYGSASSDNQRTENYVNKLYLAALGRDATSTEMQQQRDRLNNAAAVSFATVQGEAETIGRELMASQVTNFSVSESQFVTNLYEAFLQRGPDAGGLGWWTSQTGTNNSTARQNVLNAFATCGPARDLAGTLYREVYWLVNDHLGTPRMIVDKSGSLAGVKRHDYLPFGEEIGGAQVAMIGGRQGVPGYVSDTVRQKFTGYEYDAETGLNYAQARYQSSVQGRFTSVDPLGASANTANPQSFNRYTYVYNSPTNLTDPTGMMAGAEYGWSAVQDGFWGNSIPFNQNHFGGPEAISEAMGRHDRWVEIDRAGGDYGDDEPPDADAGSSKADQGSDTAEGKATEGEVTVSAEVTGVEEQSEQDSAQQQKDEPEVKVSTPISREHSQIDIDYRCGTESAGACSGGVIYVGYGASPTTGGFKPTQVELRVYVEIWVYNGPFPFKGRTPTKDKTVKDAKTAKAHEFSFHIAPSTQAILPVVQKFASTTFKTEADLHSAAKSLQKSLQKLFDKTMNQTLEEERK